MIVESNLRLRNSVNQYNLYTQKEGEEFQATKESLCLIWFVSLSKFTQNDLKLSIQQQAWEVSPLMIVKSLLLLIINWSHYLVEPSLRICPT